MGQQLFKAYSFEKSITLLNIITVIWAFTFCGEFYLQNSKKHRVQNDPQSQQQALLCNFTASATRASHDCPRLQSTCTEYRFCLSHLLPCTLQLAITSLEMVSILAWKHQLMIICKFCACVLFIIEFCTYLISPKN